MAFDNSYTITRQNKIDDMSIYEDDESPKQQINEQSLTRDLEKKSRM